MSSKNILALPGFLEQADKLPKDKKSKIFKVLSQLSSNIFHPGLQTKKLLKTNATVYECRVDRSIRLIYDVVENNLRCWYVGPHDDAIKFGNNLTRNDLQHVDDIEVDSDDKWLFLISEILRKNEIPNDDQFMRFQIELLVK